MSDSNREIPKPSDLHADHAALTQRIVDKLALEVGADASAADLRQWYRASGWAIRDYLSRRWIDCQDRYRREQRKKVYYLSLEFLIGRSLGNAVLNLDMGEATRKAIGTLGLDLEEIASQEVDAGLGNGGLGRLAACYLDSMATLGLAGFGYGIRYDYGIFTQRFDHQGAQLEEANKWLHYQNIWEVRRMSRKYTVHFGGKVDASESQSEFGARRWVDTDDVVALAYDTPIPGNDGHTVNHLRLWAARAKDPFKLSAFNAGNYAEAVEDQIKAKNLSRILYPDDTTPQGKELRLAQQYFFVSASLQDILRDFDEEHGNLDLLPSKIAIQLNDTHPALAIPELMRILLDERGLEWEKAWELTQQVFAYTNHTLLPEALEVWPLPMFETLLPRILDIIYGINKQMLETCRAHFPDDLQKVSRMSLIDEHDGRRVRMAFLAIAGSHKVNGVAELHSQLMTKTIFRDYHDLYPERFTNVTNGVTPRRWIELANPELALLISERIGNGWRNDLGQLRHLEEAADDAAFRSAFAEIKLANKRRLATLVSQQLQVQTDPASLFDVQVKRIHEYKRQLLNLLYVVARYRRLLANPASVQLARTVVFAGKAAPGYLMAKHIIKLINNVAHVINNDRRTNNMLKMTFIPNYGVSLAQQIIPAADLSEQISTAGMEASGTGNMKFAMNGALTIGTLDGANVEMLEEIGADHMFIFGLTAEEVLAQRAAGYQPASIVEENDELRGVLDMIAAGEFSPYNRDEFKPIVNALLSHGDHFLVLADYRAYAAAQERVDELYAEPEHWYRSAILNIARMGKFSSDRSVLEYARKIWHVAPANGAGD